MRLIDAKLMENHIMESKVFTQYFKELVQALIWGEDTVDAVPVVRGEWIAFDGDNTERPYNWICSSCGGGCVDNRTTYCHDCGAKLREDGE